MLCAKYCLHRLHTLVRRGFSNVYRCFLSTATLCYSLLLSTALYCALLLHTAYYCSLPFSATPYCTYCWLMLPTAPYCSLLLSTSGVHILRRWLVWISLLYPLGLSLATRHQEIRFLLPCLPGLHLFLAHVLQDLLFTPTERAGKLYAETPINEPPADSSVTTAYENVNADGSLVDKAVVDGKSKPTDGSSQKFSYTLRRNRGCMWGLFIFVGAVHIAAVLFLTLFHQVNDWDVNFLILPSLIILYLFLYWFLSFFDFFCSLVVVCSFVCWFVCVINAWLCCASKSGTETAMLQLALRLRQQHPADPSMAVVLDTQPRSSPPALNVLLLAPCHAFPGYSFLWGATRGRDFTVQLYYPDCSPK